MGMWEKMVVLWVTAPKRLLTLFDERFGGTLKPLKWRQCPPSPPRLNNLRIHHTTNAKYLKTTGKVRKIELCVVEADFVIVHQNLGCGVARYPLMRMR
jgi:hypothetical protein